MLIDHDLVADDPKIKIMTPKNVFIDYKICLKRSKKNQPASLMIPYIFRIICYASEISKMFMVMS